MKWRLGVGVIMLALVVVGLTGIRLSASRQLEVEAESSPTATSWRGHLDEVDRLLAAGERQRAVGPWTRAWTAALASRRWEPLLDVGDAALRVGDGTESPVVARANARRAYRAALNRARAQRSVDGVLGAAERFAALGDRHVSSVALEAARTLAARTPDGRMRARVELVAARIGATVVAP
jgi:hypothetical protein